MMRRARMMGGVLAALMMALPTFAQQATPQPTLDEVLWRVAQNFSAYVRSIPNLFAEEQLTASTDTSNPYGTASARGTAADAIFSLRHVDVPGKGSRLAESRQMKSIDHKPVSESEGLQVPVMEVGIFSYGASFISPSLTACYDYTLKTGQRLQKQPVLVVEYKEKKLAPRERCPVHEPNYGRAFVDPVTMQVVRMEQTRPEHSLQAMLPSNSVLRAQLEGHNTGTWDWAIDYAPVVLDGRTFLLPKTISAKTTTNSGLKVKWTFISNFRNYHLMTAHSTILPGYEVQ